MKGFWLLPLVEVKYPANGPMFRINGSSWYFVEVTGIRSLIPTGMARLMPDSFLLHTTRRRSGPARPYARGGRAHSPVPPLPRGLRALCKRGQRVQAPCPKASRRPPSRLQPPCGVTSGVFRILAACFPSRAAVKPRRKASRKSLPPFRVRFCGGAPSSKAPRVGEPAGQSGAVFRSTREVPPKPNRKRGYARWMPSRRPQSAEAGPSSKPGILRTAPVAHLARGADGIVHAEAPQTQYPRLEDGFEVTPRVEPETASSLPAGPFAQETLILGVRP